MSSRLTLLANQGIKGDSAIFLIFLTGCLFLAVGRRLGFAY